MVGWLVNDFLVPPTTKGGSFLFQNLLEWIPGLQDATYPDMEQLKEATDWKLAQCLKQYPDDYPAYIIRNASYFPRLAFDGPTIAVLQDIGYGDTRRAQLDVCQHAETVFNSEFTKSFYPELDEYPSVVIPLSIDFDMFRYRGTPLEYVAAAGGPWDVCWVGSGHPIKGPDLLFSLVEATDYSFLVINKDAAWPYPEHPRVTVLSEVDHKELPYWFSQCTIGLCTSSYESQHLAGIEMGACGLPLVTTEVGTYWNRPPDVWGASGEPNELLGLLVQQLAAPIDRNVVRAYWMKRGFTHESCRKHWQHLLNLDTDKGQG